MNINNNPNSNNNNNTNSSLPPPPIISNPSDNASANSNELPTPPSVPLSDLSTFPTHNTNNNNKNTPTTTTTTTNTHATHIPRPYMAPPPHLPPHAPPPSYYNKYYSTYYNPNPIHYNSYPIMSHYTPYPTYHPSSHHHSIPPPQSSYQYPAFNGITPNTTKKNTNTVHYQPPPHMNNHNTQTQQMTPQPISNTQTNNKSQSPSIKSITSTPQLSPKIKLNPPKINPTFRPFYECENDNKIYDNNDKNNMNVDENNESEDSDYDPLNNHTNGGKKKGKKKKKKKKKVSKKGKKKKKDNNSEGKILYLAMQQVYVTNSECRIPTKALKWGDFRAWLKYNLEPYDHQKMDKKKQRDLFTAKMQKLLNFCTYNRINNNGDIQNYYCLWLQIPQKQKWIQLIINDGNWFTNCTSEKQMMGYTTDICERDYYFFRVVEGHTNPNNIILLIRCDKGGNCGELVWLQKGQNVTGTDALAIENALSSALDLRWVYLHDDSKIKYGGNTSRSQCNLYLKTIRSIAKGQSWYSQAFYRPFNCTNWPSQTNINGKTQTGVEPGTVFTQNAQEYKNSVNLIRGFKIKKLRKLVIYNTDFNKKGEKNTGKNNNKEGDDNDEIYPIMHPSDLKKFDEVLQSMNEYDPYFEIYGKPKRLLNMKGRIDVGYFFNFSENEMDIDSGDDDNILCNVVAVKKERQGNINRRQTRSRSKRDPNDDKKEKLMENGKICIVQRWHRRRIKIKCSENSVSEYVREDCNEKIQYRRKCNTIGDLAGILYHEGNPEAWGKDKNYGLKLIRGAKENLIKFFQHILTSAELKEIKHLTPQFKQFHLALKSIENTKIFGKRSKRWALKVQKLHLQQQQALKTQQQGQKNNPIQILSQSQSPMKIIKQRQKSTEPLMDIAMERQQQINRQIYYHKQQQQQQIYYNRGQPLPHWGFRGYPSTIGRQHATGSYGNGYGNNNGYFSGFNRELRKGLAVDAEKLKLKQMQERRILNDHKTFLKKDLDSHLIPNGNDNDDEKMKSNNSNRRKLLFESLKGPSNIMSKKTVQPPLRVHRNLVDTISCNKGNGNGNNNNNNNNDTDSTLSTINNDSDTTIANNNNNNININIRDSECLNIEKTNNDNRNNRHNKNRNVIIFDVESDEDNNNNNNKQHKKHITLSGNKRQINHNSNNNNDNNTIKPPPNKRIKLDTIPIANVNHMNRDELIEEIKKYDKSFCFGVKWCGYCGSKASNSWNVRNRIILCEIHDIEYENNKQFKTKINKYKRIPRKPIDINKNTEFEYLKSKLNLELSKLKNT